MNGIPIRLLIVDDHELTRYGLRLMLSTDDITIIGEASNGREAIALSLKLKPDVILMDIEMPFMNGISALRAIKKLQPDVKFIMLTSHEDSPNIMASLAAGAHGFCRKNIPSQNLIATINAVKRGVLWLDPEILKKIAPKICDLNVLSLKPLLGEQFKMSSREMEVLSLMVNGMKNAQIANHLSVAPCTVKTHTQSIMRKLNVRDRTQAAVKVLQGKYQLPASFFQ